MPPKAIAGAKVKISELQRMHPICEDDGARCVQIDF